MLKKGLFACSSMFTLADSSVVLLAIMREHICASTALTDHIMKTQQLQF